MLKINHGMFYVQIFLLSLPYKFLVLRMRTLSFYAKRAKNGYFPLPSKFEM